MYSFIGILLHVLIHLLLPLIWSEMNYTLSAKSFSNSLKARTKDSWTRIIIRRYWDSLIDYQPIGFLLYDGHNRCKEENGQLQCNYRECFHLEINDDKQTFWIAFYKYKTISVLQLMWKKEHADQQICSREGRWQKHWYSDWCVAGRMGPVSCFTSRLIYNLSVEIPQ